MAQEHRGTMSSAPLLALARGGHYTSLQYIARQPGYVTAKFSSDLDRDNHRVALYALQLVLDLDHSVKQQLCLDPSTARGRQGLERWCWH